MAGVAPKVSVEVCEDGELIRLTVSDNGPGIPPETVYKILNLNIRTSEKAAYHSATCTLETGRRFFAGVCRVEDRPLTFRDPPLPLDSRIDLYPLG